MDTIRDVLHYSGVMVDDICHGDNNVYGDINIEGAIVYDTRDTLYNSGKKDLVCWTEFQNQRDRDMLPSQFVYSKRGIRHCGSPVHSDTLHTEGYASSSSFGRMQMNLQSVTVH